MIELKSEAHIYINNSKDENQLFEALSLYMSNADKFDTIEYAERASIIRNALLDFFKTPPVWISGSFLNIFEHQEPLENTILNAMLGKHEVLDKAIGELLNKNKKLNIKAAFITKLISKSLLKIDKNLTKENYHKLHQEALDAMANGFSGAYEYNKIKVQEEVNKKLLSF